MKPYGLVFIFVASLVTGSSTFLYPDTVPLAKRQVPGTPQYDCHADCGGVIALSRTSNYCNSFNFTSMLSDCLNCALQYDIWQYYGSSVGAAAAACNVTAVPRVTNATWSIIASTIGATMGIPVGTAVTTSSNSPTATGTVTPVASTAVTNTGIRNKSTFEYAIVLIVAISYTSLTIS